MKKFIITFFAIVIVIFAVIMLRGMFLMHKVNNLPSSYIPEYKYVENLNGIGCLEIGMTSSEAKKALDSLYGAYKSYLKNNFNSIDYVRIKKNEMLKQAEPLSYKAPLSYTPSHHTYEATLIFSEDFAIDKVQAYFWNDTLYRIHIPNSLTKADEVGEGLITKYGDGVGYNKKTNDTKDQLHRWGNDNCLITYRGKTTYSLNNQGFPTGVASWFHEVEIIKNKPDLITKIENYLHKADSLWQSERNAAKYKNL